MRNIIFAALFALGLGLIGTSGTAAAPINATPIWIQTTAKNSVEEVQWRRCWRRCNRWRCWRVCRW